MKLFCRHEWKLVNQFITESAVEQRARLSGWFNPFGSESKKKKYITDYVCSICGKLKRLKETN